jgi:hypothetical protein
MSENDPVAPPAEDAETRAATLQRRLAEVEALSRERLIRAELKAEAVRAGMVDLDGLKLVETRALTLDESGNVPGAAVLMQSLRRAKPWLFGAVNASSLATPPPAEHPPVQLATKMSTKEWLAARAELLRRR